MKTFLDMVYEVFGFKPNKKKQEERERKIEARKLFDKRKKLWLQAIERGTSDLKAEQEIEGEEE